MADEVARAMDDLVKQNLVVVRRTEFWIEVEIKTDILYPSGSAHLAPYAVDVIQRLGTALAPFPNPIRVEGHTDNKPISTVAFYSNWELSAARAGSVVRVLQAQGVGPERLAVIGYGDTRPIQPNDSEQGRNANRRVVVVILSTELQRQKAPGDQPTNGLGPIPPSTADAPATTTPDNATATAAACHRDPREQPTLDGQTPRSQAPRPPPSRRPRPRQHRSPPASPPNSPPARPSAPPPSNVTLSTTGAHVAGSGIVPAP